MALKKTTSTRKPLRHLFMRLLALTGAVTALVGAFIWQVLNDEALGMPIVIGGSAALGLALLFEMVALMQGMSSRRGAFGFNVFLQIVLAIAAVVIANVISFNHFRRLDWTRAQIFTLPQDVKNELAKLRGTTEIIVLQQYVSFGQSAENRQDKYDLAAQRKIIEKVKDLAEQFQDLGPRFRVQVLDIQDDDYLDKLNAIREQSKELAQAIEKAPENSIFFYAPERKLIQRLSFSDIYQLDKEGSMKAGDPKIIPAAALSTVGLLASGLGDGPYLATLALYPGRTDGRGNLVLKYQGIEGIARKILNIDEKKPRIATAIVHPFLGLQNRDPENVLYTMKGAKKVLDDYGFESTDIILRKLDADAELTNEPSALSYEESRYEQIEDELTAIDDSLRIFEKEHKEIEKVFKVWSESSLAELNKKYAYVVLEGGRQGIVLRTQLEKLKKSNVPHKVINVDEEDRTDYVTKYRRELEVRSQLMESGQEDRKNLLREKTTLRAERLAEKRRISDVEAKMKEMLANVDLLIVPRITLLNAPLKRLIPNRAHRLDPAQLRAIKAYLCDGKPVLFLLGPTNEPGEQPERAPVDSDPLEEALAELGFKLPRQTILYDIEAKEYNERKVGVILSTRDIEVPGLVFDAATKMAFRHKYKDPFQRGHANLSAPETASLVGLLAGTEHAGPLQAVAGLLKPEIHTEEALKAHPIRTSLNVINRTAGNKESYDVKIRHPRPVYYLRTSIAPEAVASIIGSVTLPGFAPAIQVPPSWLYMVRRLPDDNAVFLLTAKESWNEDNPFISESNRVPRYHSPQDDDPKKGTVEEMRRGSFPIGAAAEMAIPDSWYDKDDDKRHKARVAVIGSGGVFIGTNLPPLKQKMLLDVVNWLLHRDELLAKDNETWQYPRVYMTQSEFAVWEWGARLGLPLLFIYLGLVVSLVRRMR